MPHQFTELVEAQDTRIFGDTEGVFVQDTWKPFSWLTVRPGVRFDTARMRNFADEAQMAMNTFSPRIGVAWNQQRPRTHEFILGAARELMPDLELAANFVYRYHGNQWEDDESNVLFNEEGDSAIGFVNGEQRFIYSLGAMKEAFIRYMGVTVSLNKRFSRNWEMIASYTWSRTEGTEAGIITIAFDNPRQRDVEYGWLPHDQRHVVKIYGSYRLPYGIVLGGRFTYMSGRPYNRWVFNSFYGGYVDRRSPRGVDINADGEEVPLRLPDQFIADIRVMWQLDELIDQRIDLIFETLNAFNARTATEVEQDDLPTGGVTAFGDVTDRLDPLTFNFGLRFRY